MNFDLTINRTRTASLKWDIIPTVFGVDDALPMWVADMDFAAPPAVVRAMHARVEHGVFGYTLQTETYNEAITSWMEKRHNWSIKPEWIQYCPGVVPALSLLVEAFTEPGDQVIIQTPVYPPFYSVVKDHGRELVQNPLILTEQGDYVMDFEDLERSLSGGRVKMIILCSPHNPVGRVWTKEELSRIASLCEQHDVLVVSDEIHADLIYKTGSHTPFASLSEDAAMRSFICTAASKTFNIAGLNTANIIIPNDTLRRRFDKALQRYALGSITPMGAAATEAAYREGGEWLDALLSYVRGNMEYIRDFIQEHMPEVKVKLPQATYLLWIDFRGLGMSDEDLNRFLVQKAKIGMNRGVTFGKNAEGFMRMNMACTRATAEEAMSRLHAAIVQWRKEAE
ncbi:pyridoxal phosphate-dependent aminotransferase [Paenibacillus sp. N3/727]|uniref:MalY/PatB family protein n=1 Tax=Paenibacillus sp. N3/727 TaxID=2925845 RepID=UPI001F52FCBA|nr:MalY/PatB family protein [Paenibacillus sp. N3/727]UNK19709.1 pyridoxal phosphate-dependent aminotransferase [Paenibacillus sp. N3/727]